MTDEIARGRGRPRTTVKDLPVDWETIMREAAQEGASAVEIRCLLGIGDSAWETLIEDDSDFHRTVKECKALCQVWWERTGRKMAGGEADGNATVWIFNMKNRFGWKDKTETEHTGSVAVTQITRRIIKPKPDSNGTGD